MDFPGEDLVNELRKLQDGNEALRDHYSRADSLLLLFDPDRDIRPDASLSAAERDVHLKRLDALVSAVQNRELHSPPAKDGTAAKRKPSVAVVLTKADLHPSELTGRRAARSFFRRHAVALDEKLRMLAGAIAYFPLSATGGTEAAPPRDGEPSPPRPAAKLSPTGYEAIFGWVGRQLWWRRWGVAVKALAASVCVALLTVAVSVGVTLARHERALDVLRDEARSAIERQEETKDEYSGAVLAVRRELFDSELWRITGGLSGSNTEESLEDLVQQVDRLLRANPGVTRQQLDDLRERAGHKTTEILFNRVLDSYDRKAPEFEDLARQFLRDKDDPGFRTQVKDWLKADRSRRLRAARDAVRDLSVFNAATLRSKAEKVKWYLETWDREEDPVTVKQMRRAAELAVRFGQRNKYTITVAKSGEYTDSYGHRVVVRRAHDDGKHWLDAFDRTAPGNNSKSSIWENTKFELEWWAGLDIAVCIFRARFLFPDQKAAEMVTDGPLAILRLCGRADLKATPEWADYFADGPYVEFQVIDANGDAITAADVAAVRKYISPGGAWK